MEYTQPPHSVWSRSESSITSFLLSYHANMSMFQPRTTAPDLLASTQDSRIHFNLPSLGLLLSQPHVNATANTNTNFLRMRSASMSTVSTLVGTASSAVDAYTCILLPLPRRSRIRAVAQGHNSLLNTIDGVHDILDVSHRTLWSPRMYYEPRIEPDLSANSSQVAIAPRLWS